MAWYLDSSNLSKTDGKPAHWSNEYGPADKVPVSGIYKCIGCKKEITSNKHDPFPPQNDHQHSREQGTIRWKLIVRTNTEGN